MRKLILGIDMGGTKTAAGIFEYDGELLSKEVLINPKTDDAEEVWNGITDLIDKVSAPYIDEIIVCGVGAAGPGEPKGKSLSPANLPAWKKFPLRERLEAHIGKTAYIEDDCKALAMGEGWKGSAVGKHNYISMVVSTGIGGGIVLDGKLLHGHGMMAGHVGHIIINPNGPLCGCGQFGCIEAHASGPALLRKFGIAPEKATLEMKEYCADMIAHLICIVTATLDINWVTIGGSVALGFGDVFFNRAQETYDKMMQMDFGKGLKIVPSGLGIDGGLISAARVGKLGYRGILWSS